MKAFIRLLRPRYLLWLLAPLLLLWSLHAVSLREIWVVLGRLGLVQILILIVANGLVILTLSGRWWLILRTQGYPIPYLTLAGYRLAAFGVSYFTPGPQFGGEPLQVYVTHQRHQVPRPTAIAAVTLDKSLELLANFAFLTAGIACILQWQVFTNAVGKQAILVPLALLALPVGYMVAVWAGGHPLSGLLQASAKLFPRQRWSGETHGLPAYQKICHAIRASEEQAMRFCRNHPLALAQALGVSLLSWVAIAGEYWLMLHVLGLSPTPVQIISALTAARIAFLLPLPGGLGSLEASQVFALAALGLNPAAGISLSLLIRARDVTLGGLGLWWGGLVTRSFITWRF